MIKIEKKNLKNKTLSIRLTSSVYESLDKLAKKAGVSKADYIEALIIQETKSNPKK